MTKIGTTKTSLHVRRINMRLLINYWFKLKYSYSMNIVLYYLFLARTHWTHDLKGEKYYVDFGCFKGSGHYVPGTFLPKSFRAAVRCCGNDGYGLTCEITGDRPTGVCPNDRTTYDNAALQCAQIGRRLCTQNELRNRVCCRFEKNCNPKRPVFVWTSTSDEVEGN